MRDMKSETKTKISYILWPALYFALAIVLSVSISIFATKTGYTRIFVYGTSMNPTLDGGNGKIGDTVDFGYADPSKQVIDNLKRFNIVTTYYPNKWQNEDYDSQGKLLPNASYKIKRVIGFPEEIINLWVDDDENRTCHINITSGQNSITYTYSDDDKGWYARVDEKDHLYKFEIKHSTITHETISKNFSTRLGKNEYFLMGDNWDVSSDSSSNMCIAETGKKHITRDNLQGVLIGIEGKATIVIDPKTGSRTVDNLKYTSTKYYYQEL